MCADLDFVLHRGDERRRAFLCIALVGALLYNPFFTVLSSSLNITAQHPLSYRATLASSELRRCTLETEKPLIPALAAVVFFLMVALSYEVSPVQSSDSIVPKPHAASDGIWVRPPPFA